MGDSRDDQIVAESTFFEKSSDNFLFDATKEEKHDTDNVLSKENVQETSPVPTLVERPQQQWNHPRINVWRTVVACYGLCIMGMNDAAYGVCVSRRRIETLLIFGLRQLYLTFVSLIVRAKQS